MSLAFSSLFAHSTLNRKLPVGNWGSLYTLDGVPYLDVECGIFPDYFCDVDVTVMDQGEKVACKIVAGHVAVQGSLPEGTSGISDTLAPSAQWFVFENRS